MSESYGFIMRPPVLLTGTGWSVNPTNFTPRQTMLGTMLPLLPVFLNESGPFRQAMTPATFANET